MTRSTRWYRASNELARREGARVVSGGELVEGEGFYVQPTILAHVLLDPAMPFGGVKQ